MKKRIIKVAVAVALIFSLVLTFASCATTTAKLPDAKSANGTVEGTSIIWSYDKDTKTLSITGTGAIPNFENSEKVSWYSARHSIEKIKISEGITAIGDYAFYYSPKLTEVTIPSTTLTIGKLSFAFCFSLKSVVLPDGLTSLGDGCFEACTALEGIFVPAAVTSMGERVFMSCTSLKDAIIMAQLGEIKALSFKSCKSLTTLCFNTSVQGKPVAANAFEDASKSFDTAEFTESMSGNVTLTVKYLYADGSEAAPALSQEYAHGQSYSVVSPAITGYTASQLTVSGVISSYSPVEVTVTYTSDTVETEAETTVDTQAPADGEDDEVNAGTIIAVVILVIVIAGVAVVAVFMMRADKNDGKGGVRKNNADSSKKNNKK